MKDNKGNDSVVDNSNTGSCGCGDAKTEINNRFVVEEITEIVDNLSPESDTDIFE